MTEPTTSTASTTASSCPLIAPATTGSSFLASEPDARLGEPGFRLVGEVRDAVRGHLPLSVWLAEADTESIATCPAGCCHPVSGRLARHLVAACTRPGETVVHLGASDHQLVSAALTAGCLPVAVFADVARAGVSWTCLARTHPDYDLEVTELRVIDPRDESSALADLAGGAGLVVTEQTCQQPLSRSKPTDRLGTEGEAEDFDVTCAAGLVKPGGHLAVVTGLHREAGVVDPMPQIITQAREAGLVYLQHIIALRHPARGEHIDPDLSHCALAAIQEPPECPGLPASARAHSDLLIFTKPRTPSGPDGSTALASEGAVEPNGAEGSVQTGGER
ncbi:hypothetical protein ACIBQ1_36805 [Nonomuraea sp. NPDC050153]|uniref:hypothetical protein n=1 Tax=Nonomuraea sp. NPDC050153 TaxID=3364359 RepID=UPI0037BDC5B4